MKAKEVKNPTTMIGSRRDRMTEGGLHSAMLMEALGKLPKWHGVGYRGERMNQARFNQRFAKAGDKVTARNPSEVVPAFWSVSMDIYTASVRQPQRRGRDCDHLGAVPDQGRQRPRCHGLLQRQDGRGGAVPGRVHDHRRTRRGDGDRTRRLHASGDGLVRRAPLAEPPASRRRTTTRRTPASDRSHPTPKPSSPISPGRMGHPTATRMSRISAATTGSRRSTSSPRTRSPRSKPTDRRRPADHDRRSPRTPGTGWLWRPVQLRDVSLDDRQ